MILIEKFIFNKNILKLLDSFYTNKDNLIIAYNVFIKFFVFLELGNDQEKEAIDILDINKDDIKDWRLGKTNYSIEIVKIMIEKIYQAWERSCNNELWFEELQYYLIRLIYNKSE